MRFLSAQLQGCFQDGAWLRRAAHANDMAAGLAERLAAIPGIRITNAVDGNMIFAEMSKPVHDGLKERGYHFGAVAQAGGGFEIRLVTAFATQQAEVDTLAAALAR